MNCYEAIDHMGDALEGRLALELRPGFDEHLVECPACRIYLDQLRTTVETLEHLPRPALTHQRRSELIAAFQREWKKTG